MKKREILALTNFRSKINAINPIYVAKLVFQMQKTEISVQKIVGFFLKIYSIIIITS